jgi:predicted DNA-binding transcriptional regulator YafY
LTIIAFCLNTNEYRTFRVDRVKNIIESDKAFTIEHPSLEDFLKSTKKTEKLEEVIISIPKDKEAIIGDDKYYYGLVSRKEVKQNIELTFLTFSIDKFAHWYLSFSDVAKIVSPEKLKENIREIIACISF